LRALSTNLFFTFALFVCAADANPLSPPGAGPSLTPRKGDGIVRLDTSFRRSSEFFAGGERRETTVEGLSETFDDWVFAFETAYGLTDRWGLWLSIPVIHRNASLSTPSQTYDAGKTGLGDVTAGARYVFFHSGSGATEAALDLNGKFPSGDTGVHFINAATGDTAQLPLGGGYSEIEPGLALRQRFGNRLSAFLSAAYAFRFSALVEYLSTDSIPFAASDGTVYLLPVGNLRVDWGDQLTLRGALGWDVFGPLRIETGTTWFYRRPLRIHSFGVTQSGTTITTTPADQTSGSSQLFTLTPAVSADLSENLRLRASADIPLLGRNYPLLPVVESAVGNTYRLEASYAF
jgi:hypothetical protein